MQSENDLNPREVVEKDGKTKTIVYDFFKPLWDENTKQWLLQSVKTGHQYWFYELTNQPVNSRFESYHEEYHRNLDEASLYHMTPVFATHWLKMLLYYESMEYADNKRLQFLKDNLLPDLSPKESAKVSKKSEQVYQSAYPEFFTKFNDW
jgi:hypothetical protein